MMIQDIKRGMRVFWNDPDTEFSNSGYGTVNPATPSLEYDDDIIHLNMADGGEVECFAHELNAA
jgi:hypothetical protein